MILPEIPMSFRTARSADPESISPVLIVAEMQGLWIPGSLAALAPRNDGEGFAGSP